MSEKSNKRMVVVGLFISIGLLFLIGGILIIGNLHETFSRKLHITALFSDVQGLQEGNNIWFSGVKIGTVSNIRFLPDAKVNVQLRIASESQKYIRKDAKVKISTDGLIGNRIIVIYGGTKRSDVIQEYDTLKVVEALSSDDIMSTLQENNKNLLSITGDIKKLSKNLADGKGTAGKLLQDSSLYINLSNTTVLLRNAVLKADRALAYINEFSSGLNQKGSFGYELTHDTAIIADIRSTATHLKSTSDSALHVFSDISHSVNDTATVAGVLFSSKSAGVNLQNTLKNLGAASVKLDEDLEALQHNFLFRKYFRKKEKK